MKELEIYVHSINGDDPKLIRIDEEKTVEEAIKTIKAELKLPPESEFFLFIEDEEKDLESHRKLIECGVKHRHHLHCHTCRRIHVIVSYNGVQKENQFSPSTKVRAILKWALYAFGLLGADAEGKVLRLSATGQELLSDAHIGSFAKSSECQVKLALTPIVRVEG